MPRNKQSSKAEIGMQPALQWGHKQQCGQGDNAETKPEIITCIFKADKEIDLEWGRKAF